MISLLKFAWGFSKSNKRLVGGVVGIIAALAFSLAQEWRIDSARARIVELEDQYSRASSTIAQLRSTHAQELAAVKAELQAQRQASDTLRADLDRINSYEDEPLPAVLEDNTKILLERYSEW